MKPSTTIVWLLWSIMLSTVYWFIKLKTLGNEACDRSGGDLARLISFIAIASLSRKKPRIGL